MAAPSSVSERHAIIRNLLTNILELGESIVVDKDSGRISFADRPEEPILFRTQKSQTAQPLVIYQLACKIPNAILMNPFVEPVGEDPTDKRWFYNVTNRIHTTTVARILEFIFENVVKAAQGEQIDDPQIIHVLSGIIGNADVKTGKELTKIFSRIPEYSDGLDDKMISECQLVTTDPKPKDFVTISRSKREKRAILTSFMQDDENVFKKKFGSSIRKKTWTLIEQIFKEIYMVTDLSGPLIEETVGQSKCPSFIAYLKVLCRAWNCLIPYFKFIFTDDQAQANIERIVFIESCFDQLENLATVATWARGCLNGIIELKDGSMDKTISDDNTTTNYHSTTQTQNGIPIVEGDRPRDDDPEYDTPKKAAGAKYSKQSFTEATGRNQQQMMYPQPQYGYPQPNMMPPAPPMQNQYLPWEGPNRFQQNAPMMNTVNPMFRPDAAQRVMPSATGSNRVTVDQMARMQQPQPYAGNGFNPMYNQNPMNQNCNPGMNYNGNFGFMTPVQRAL